MDTLLQDLRYAARSLARSPVLSLAAVLTLGLGIGANTAMFGVVDRLFFRPPAHVTDPGRVARLNATVTMPPVGTFTGPIATFARYRDFRDQARSLKAVAAYGSTRFSLGFGERAERVSGEMVTASFFPLLGVRPVLGRFFSPDEDRIGGEHVVVLSSEFWQRQFGGQPAVLGQTLQLGRSGYTVVGVAPAGFAGIDFKVPDVWVPISVAAPETMGPDALGDRYFWLEVIGRLGDGVSPARAAAEGTAIYRGRFTQTGDSTGVVSLGPVHEALGPNVGTNARLALWLAAVCGIVLLIACANVTNLLLARAVQRRREIAVRLALGASRGDLARQLLAEGALLAAVGGAAAILVTLWLGPVLRAALLTEASAGSPFDLRLLAFTGAAVAVTTIAAGMVPALQASAPDLTAALKAGARGGSLHRSATRMALLVGQVALTLVLLTGAGLFISSLRHARHLRLGFDGDRLISASVDLSSLGYAPADIDAQYERLRERVLGLPGVSSASLAIGNPFGSSFAVSLDVPGLDSEPRLQASGPYINQVTDDYFGTMGTRVLRGRGFTAADTKGAQRVAVVNQTMARLYWLGESALGKCLKIGGRNPPCTEVVGVVEDALRGSIREGPTVQYYVPLAQADSSMHWPVSALLIRTSEPAEQLVAAVRREVQATDPNLPYPDIDPMPRLLARQLRPWQIGSTLLSLFGALGLLLAAIGLYGVLSYVVSQRTQELGIRIALGAARRDLLGLVVRQGMQVTLMGVVIGAIGALVAGKAIASLLYQVSPRDPVVLSSVAMILVLVALVASYLPARRATRVDPMVALRYE
jgi:predicted permease